jgi:hypothetical protein
MCNGHIFPWGKLTWLAKLPLMIKIFMWQLAKDKLASSKKITKRHGRSNRLCMLCGSLEYADHIWH